MNTRQLAGRLLVIVSLLGVLADAPGAPPPASQCKTNHPAENKTNIQAEKFAAEGDALQTSGQLSDALAAYRKAAKLGHVKGAFGAGDILFNRGLNSDGRDRVLELSESLGYLYFAATNRHPEACAKLADALQNGIGVATNRVCAYAWLQLAVQNSPAFKTELDQLVIRLEPDEIRQAQILAREYAAGRWPARIARPVDQGDARLAVQGVVLNGSKTLFVLNGKTMTASETVEVFPANNPRPNAAEKMMVSCSEIGPDYVLLLVAGEPNLKLLSRPHD